MYVYTKHNSLVKLKQNLIQNKYLSCSILYIRKKESLYLGNYYIHFKDFKEVQIQNRVKDFKFKKLILI